MFININITKPMRDFMHACLQKHKQLDMGDYEAYIWSSGFLDRERSIRENRRNKERWLSNTPDEFRSVWELPAETNPDQTRKGILYLISRYGRTTQLQIIYMRPSLSESFTTLKKAISEGLDVLEALA